MKTVQALLVLIVALLGLIAYQLHGLRPYTAADYADDERDKDGVAMEMPVVLTTSLYKTRLPDFPDSMEVEVTNTIKAEIEGQVEIYDALPIKVDIVDSQPIKVTVNDDSPIKVTVNDDSPIKVTVDDDPPIRVTADDTLNVRISN